MKPVGLLLFLALIPMQVVRARKESEVLEAAFGDKYGGALRGRRGFEEGAPVGLAIFSGA